MTNKESSPPRWAEVTLRSLLRPSDRESISGDLLEEYREVRRPALGVLRADAWYIKHVLSVLWRLVWPCATAMVALKLASLPVRLWWNPSIVQAPGVSLLDGAIYLMAGYYGSQRTGLIRTGAVAAGATSILGIAIFFVWEGLKTPSLLMAPFLKPFIFVIMSVLLLIALGCGVILGSVGGVVGRWLPPTPRKEARVS